MSRLSEPQYIWIVAIFNDIDVRLICLNVWFILFCEYDLNAHRAQN